MAVWWASFDTCTHTIRSVSVTFCNLQKGCTPRFCPWVQALTIWSILVYRKANWSVYLSMPYWLGLIVLTQWWRSAWRGTYRSVLGSKAVLIMFSFLLKKSVLCLTFDPLPFWILGRILCCVSFIGECCLFFSSKYLLFSSKSLLWFGPTFNFELAYALTWTIDCLAHSSKFLGHYG